MPNLNISLPDQLKQWVDGQIAEGRYSSAGDYVRALIRADERRSAEEALETALLEGLNTPERILDDQEWSAIREEASARLASREQTADG
jgi:antitoxin ParD1/3/4